MIIAIDGPPGSGKSTVAGILSKMLGYRLESAGRIFRTMARERGVSLEEFGAIAQNDLSIDQALDEKTVDITRQSEYLVIEGRLTAPILSKYNIRAFRVYINAPLPVRADRVAKRDDITTEQAREAISKREASENDRYHSLYGITQGDRSSYDLVVDSGTLTAQQVVDIIYGGFDRWRKSL